ncbi:hypothetical protein CB0940_03744 [Cercospora beticola]|uniref:F-box domain-containing protein n=1 Tax=Cercospora beticola TaxID=122368 RepID=A0A2G5I435_CERBT|nr:hypothetical protein CB0940_03744 [Cercospora beticola]PIA99528.1 hypothetical protein CB0940_03744 [Cercospora beticola]WPB00936.1 hypothetical protein RHO25_005556 [Cercospora beticola]CAK1360807.1 unnamed protein product [Cercospora beticola]
MDSFPSNIFTVLPFHDHNAVIKPSRPRGDADHIEKHRAAIANKDAKTTIQSLPAELMLGIVSHLPPREIQRCRGVSSSFRGVIDDNQKSLLKAAPAQCQAIVDAQYYNGTPQEPSFCKFLFWYLSKRGIWKDPKYIRRSTKRCLFQWLVNWAPEIGAAIKYFPESERPANQLNVTWKEYPDALINILQTIAEALVQTYIDTRIWELSTHDFYSPKLCDVSTVKKFMEIVDCADPYLVGSEFDLTATLAKFGLPLSREELRQNYLDIKARKEPALPAFPPSLAARDSENSNGFLTNLVTKEKDGNELLHIPEVVNKRHAFPKLYLTSLEFHPGAWKLGHFVFKELRAFLDVHLPYVRDDLAYRVRSTWAFDLLWEAKKRGRVLTEWEKAAVLEELYVC